MTEKEVEEMAEIDHSNGRPWLLLGFIVGIFDNLAELDTVLGLLIKLSSLVSFAIFVFLNYPRIRVRFRQIFKKQKLTESKQLKNE